MLIGLFLRPGNHGKLVRIDHDHLLHRCVDLRVEEVHTGGGFDGNSILRGNPPREGRQPFGAERKRLQGNSVLGIQKANDEVGRTQINTEVSHGASSVAAGAEVHAKACVRKVLVDDDLVLTESVAMVLYLAEQYPHKGLVPTDI